MNTARATIHVMLRIWQEDGQLFQETEFAKIFCKPELMLELPPREISEYDWIEDSLTEIFDLADLVLPEKFEVCEDVLLYEAIGVFTIEDTSEDWDTYNFELQKWSVDFEEVTE